ncbi:MAG: thioredoxin family protein [Chitinophagales bacterium]|nr:thioredoxin family protein [Chitinophagales bacterium]
MSNFNHIIQDETPVLVDCWAVWCTHCKPVPEILKQVKIEIGDKVRIIKIDIDKNPAFANQWHVQGVPMLMLFKEGKMIWRHAGALPASVLIEKIKPYINR